MTQQQPSNHIPEAKKMVPGDELHLTLLMAPCSLHLVTGQDRQHLLAFGRAAFEAGQAAAQQAVQAAAPLPLLLRDIARDLGITVPQACIALKPLGNYSTNSAVTAEMARMLRDHFPAPAHPAEGVPAQAEPFMWAIQEPGGSAYMDKNCVSTSRGIVEAEVDGLNLGLDADDEPYKVVPVYLAATKPAQAVPSDDDAFQAAIDMLHSARVELDLLREALNVPVEPHQSLFERVLDAAKATHPTQQGMDAGKLLAEKHTGMKVDYRGLLGQVRRAIKHTSGGHEEMLRQLEGHITELGQRWYAGDTAVVDELLQLYCVEREARAALAAQAKQGGAA